MYPIRRAAAAPAFTYEEDPYAGMPVLTDSPRDSTPRDMPDLIDSSPDSTPGRSTLSTLASSTDTRPGYFMYRPLVRRFAKMADLAYPIAEMIINEEPMEQVN